MPVDGPPRWTFTHTSGSSVTLARPSISALSEKPGPDVAVMDFLPANDAPTAADQVGAVNEKVEGFFDLCVARGLESGQGAVLPASNVSQLMLRQDVIAAVAAGRFTMYAVQTVDQALAVLTGMPAGDPTVAADDTVNGRINRRLHG